MAEQPAHEQAMQKLLRRVTSGSWNDWLDKSEVWLTRFMITAILLLVIGVVAQAPSEEVDLQAGLAAQSQQEYWRAEDLFQQAALLAPHDVRPLLDLARLHRLERRYDLAQSELDTARSLDSTQAGIWLTEGDLAHDQGQTAQAIRAWLQATRLTPDDAQMQAREQLGLLYEQQFRFHDAEAQFAALPASDTLARYHLGALLLERGDLAGARQDFQAVLNNTQHADLSAAAQAFLQAIQQANSSAQSAKLIGFTYIQNYLPWLARAPLQRATALNPGDAYAHAYLGWTYLSTGALDQATQEERQAVTLEPDNGFAHFVLCLLSIDNGDYTAAIDAIETALISDPQNPLFWATRGQIAEQLNDPPTAENALGHAVQYGQGDPEFSLLLATFYADYHLGLSDGTALQAAQTAVGQDPGNGLAYDALGQIQQEMNNLTGALQSFDQAVALDPTSASLHTHLGALEAALGYLRSAVLNLRKAAVLDFNGPTGRAAQQLLQGLPSYPL
ncbi:MAG TPA: tetratricopeptide repeat protein [Ktedonobacterales bacterium]|nr:tetratricopeptide repeat protein [Ktedonobacterales bacterium]